MMVACPLVPVAGTSAAAWVTSDGNAAHRARAHKQGAKRRRCNIDGGSKVRDEDTRVVISIITDHQQRRYDPGCRASVNISHLPLDTGKQCRYAQGQSAGAVMGWDACSSPPAIFVPPSGNTDVSSMRRGVAHEHTPINAVRLACHDTHHWRHARC